MVKYLFKISADKNDTVDKMVKAWKKKVDSTKILKRLKSQTCYVKPKERRKHRDSLALYLQRMRTERNR